ncbi:serine/threonine-protein kinase [Nocardiopsis alba]|uniref:serine/threonine-protein kinase n=1 Tax=Nocardiopsis alba TaxID=53437 RepID=UPI0003474419|nr:serine/threonine-protein kinase [Nocardiopsis alba]
MSSTPEPTSPPPGLSPLKESDPTVIGPYRLVGRIGAGGMGAVYGALDVYGRCVAVKTVHADLAAKPRFREAFAREVAMLDRVDGVGAARLHAHDTEAEVPWLAFDHVPGRDLRAHVREFGPLEGEMLRVFALGMAEGLSALHTAGVAHRDVKPGNVILAPDGPKLVDFGIAVEIGTERSEDASASYGTPGWTAPERYTGAEADPAADVFAWGGLVTLAATRRTPFGTGDADELARRVSMGEYDVTGVPEGLRALVEAALSVDPGLRPTSAELVETLLPEPEEGHEDSASTSDILRRMLRDYWRGVDAAGHDPAHWAAWLGGASAAGLGVVGTLGGTVGAGGATAGGAAGSTAGATAAASGGTGAVVSGASSSGAAAGIFGGGSSAGGALGGVAGSKLAMVGAGALAVAGVAAGGYVAYDRLWESPADVVASAAVLLEETGFVATVERTPVGGGETVSEEYLYSADGESFLIRGAAMGPGTTAVAVHQGELYVYAPPEEVQWTSWEYESEHIDVSANVDWKSLERTLLVDPLASMADSGDIDVSMEGPEQKDHTRYTGTAMVRMLIEGAWARDEMDASVEVDPEGVPVHVEYRSAAWDITIDLERSGTPVEILDPQLIEEWSVAHAPICERLYMTDRNWDVRAAAWEMDCGYATEVTDMLFDEWEARQDNPRLEFLAGYSGSGVATYLVDDSFACGSLRIDIDYPEDRWWRPTPCLYAEPTGDEVWEGMSEYEFGDLQLIQYVEVT